MKTQGATKDVVFLSGVRTGFGAFGGSLKDLSAIDLGAAASRHAIQRSGVPASDFGHTVFGNALQTSADAIYMARHVGLKAGLPIEAPAVTVNRLCGSGFEAVIQGAQQILLGQSRVVLAGGTESMSQAPHVIRGARWGLPFGKAPPLEDLLWTALTDSYAGCAMGMTAEALAELYNIDRAACDAYALLSQKRWAAADEAGRFRDEIAPVDVRGRKGAVQRVERDEHARPQTTLEALAKLAPSFKPDGVVTAGNASGLADGAAALVVASRAAVTRAKRTPLGRLLAWGYVGVDPKVMGIGPVPAIAKALQRARLRLDDMDLIEVNEAFAPQYLAVEKEAGLPRDKTNVDGGAIAIGHPLGASGARIVTHLLYELHRRKSRYGIGAACIGGGQGIAVIVESLL